MSCRFRAKVSQAKDKFKVSQADVVRYLASWFHVFDSFIIGLALIIGTMTGGVVTDVGSLVIALRLWRLAQLSDEIVLDAQERIHGLEQRNQELSDEIVAVRHRLDLYHV